MLELMPQFKNLDRKFLSLEDSSEQDIIDVVEKHAHSDHSKKAHDKAMKEEAATGVFKQRFMPIVDSLEWKNLLYMVRVDDLQYYTSIQFKHEHGSAQSESQIEYRRSRPAKCILLALRR